MSSSADPRDVPPPARGFGALLYWLGGGFLLAAALLDARLVGAFHETTPLTAEALHETSLSRGVFAAVGFALLFVGVLERRGGRPLRGRLTVRLWTVLILLLAPLLLLERVLAPFVEHPTTLFLRDPELGWKLRPGASDFWMGAPVRVNARGLRGPERPYAKPPGVARVLFLGDSVTFGARIADDAATLPAQVEARLAEGGGRAVECINAAVGGYSPWQEVIVLREEGARYEPDAVVLCFVLNDVTELYELERFGGDGEGFQLAHTRAPSWRGWFAGSALQHFARELGARLEFGAEVQEGARQRELLGLQHLALEPERAGVRGAWQLTLNSVQEIVDWCRAHEVPLLVAMIPWLPQLETPGLMAPNEHLRAWCAARAVAFLDLAPELARRAGERGVAPGALYVPDDAIHPSELGHELLGGAVAAELGARGWLAR